MAQRARSGVGRSKSGFGLLLLLLPLAALAQGGLSGELALGYDDNLANAREGRPRHQDQYALASVAAAAGSALGRGSALQWRLELEAQQFAEVQALSNARASLRARWLYRPDAGFYTPTLGLGAAASLWEFDSGLRDSRLQRFELLLQEQLTSALALQLAARLLQREAAAAVFDGSTRSLALDLDWQPLPRLALYAGAQWQDGMQLSSAPAAPPFGNRPTADDAFPGETAFRLEARTRILSLGLNYALSSHLALDLELRRIVARADAGPRYERDQALASLLWRY